MFSISADGAPAVVGIQTEWIHRKQRHEGINSDSINPLLNPLQCIIVVPEAASVGCTRWYL